MDYTIYTVDNYGNTPLHKVAITGDMSTIDRLGELAARINGMWINKDSVNAKNLINSGANVNAKNSKRETVLHILLSNSLVYIEDWNKSIELFKLLISRGADVNAKNSQDSTPLHLSIFNENMSIIQLLIELGATVDCKDEDQKTPLHYAVSLMQGAKIVELLLKNGASVDSKDFNDRTPIYRAVKNEVSIVQLLIDHGASVNCKDKCQQTPLHSAAEGQHSGDEIIELLLRSGAHINAKDFRNETPLHRAVFNKNVSIVKILLKNEAYVNALNYQGQSPLCFALSPSHRASVEELLAYGANVKGNKCLMYLRGSDDLSLFYKQYMITLLAVDLLFITTHASFINNVNDRIHYNNCLREIKKLKSTLIDSCTSWYDFLHMRPERRWVYINCTKFLDIMQSPEFNKKFPVYSKLVLAKYNEAKTKNQLFKPAKEALYKLIEAQLSDDIDHILVHLDDVDLINIIEAVTIV